MSNRNKIKEIILNEIEEDSYNYRVEDVIIWALDHYAKSEPKGTWGIDVADSIVKKAEQETKYHTK